MAYIELSLPFPPSSAWIQGPGELRHGFLTFVCVKNTNASLVIPEAPFRNMILNTSNKIYSITKERNQLYWNTGIKILLNIFLVL